MTDNVKIITADSWGEQEIKDALELEGPILIVGASGFIGAKMFYSLSKVRDDVYACSPNVRQSWRLKFADQAKLISVDICEYDQLLNKLTTIKPRTVFNFSAYGAYSRQTDSFKIHQTNYIGVLNLIKALMEIGCSAFVQAGSSSEYGLNCAGTAEQDELLPNSDYSVSKVSSSYLIKYYGKLLNFPAVNLRLYSVYGPFEERDRLIPSLIQHGLEQKLPNFVSKEISRDFVYIDDVTHAFVRAALTACKNNPGASINIATGKQTKLEDVARIAKTIFNIQEKPVFGSMQNRKWDLSNWFGNPSLAKKYMNWSAKTSFEVGLKMNIEWEKISAKYLRNASSTTRSKKISAIFACYKDNLSIPVLYQRSKEVFEKSGYDYELIFVNDGSPANDGQVIEALSATDSHVIGVYHSRNFGSQSGFLSGMEISSGDAVVLMDGDGQDPPEIIIEFIKKWEDGYDVVYGERVKREASLYMQIFYKIFYRIFRKLSDIKIPVDAGDFSLIDRKVVTHLLSFSEKDVFLRGLRAWVGFKQVGVPYSRPERLFGKSTNNFQKNIWWAKKGIFSFSSKPLYYIQLLGVWCFIVTMLVGLYYVVNYFIHPPSNAPGITTIIILVLAIGSIQLISLSIIGDYISKIVEEVKGRPRFIREKLVFNGKSYFTDAEIKKVAEELKNRS